VSGLIPILALGTLVLLLGSRLVVQRTRARHAAAVTLDDYSAAQAMLESLFLETSVIERIFAPDDVEFISQVARPDIKRFFLSERKALAIHWLRMVQTQVRELMNLHLKLASYTHQPNPRIEFELAVEYGCFVLASNALLILLWARGPFEARKTVAYTLRTAQHFCSVISVRLEKIDPAKLAAAR
jgi:hypothetical protein